MTTSTTSSHAHFWLLSLLLFGVTLSSCSGRRTDDLNTRNLKNEDAQVSAASDSEDAGACEDEDHDSHGTGCPAGRDCDDQDPMRYRGRDAFEDRDQDGYGAKPVFVCVSDEDSLPPGYAADGDDCDDANSAINPGLEIDGCDLVDVDCDDKVDEDLVPLPSTCGAGACRGVGQTTCTDDGGVDDSCVTGLPTGADDDCNGLDDDCDGVPDDGYRAQPSRCERDGCTATGMIQCIAGQIVDDCRAPARSASDATCDGLDDDCDGQVDEEFPAQSTSCGAGACVAGGQTSCREGRVVDSCAPLPAGLDDDCDRVDDDCDGQPDDDFVALATTCGSGACRKAGTITCVGGQRVDSCVAGAADTTDTSCNGVDDDCDGQVDEDFRGASRACGEGACAASAAEVCVNGEVKSACVPGTGSASDATCDGIDDDCSGAPDEDFAPRAISCGVGECRREGSISCAGGHEVSTCSAGSPSPDTDCDGRDDDCDGTADEDYVPTPTACGVGACATTGTLRCVAGQAQDTCNEGRPGGQDTSCDGVDSDRDGRVDDDYVARSVTCGVGACQRTIQTSCSGGVETACIPGGPTGSDDDCDGVDDDCDGSTDESFPVQATGCGIGDCARSGTLSCVAGRRVDSCKPGPAAASDANCDDVDDDCNGVADEDYRVSISCGQGMCINSGTRTCRAGAPVDECTPLPAPSRIDAVCNKLDEDCDGAVDEDYAASNTSCGLGACTSTGQLLCMAGVHADTCMPKMPVSQSDTVCNGVDDDCDGRVDDDYRPQGFTCGVGSCEAKGSTVCEGGREDKRCAPGTPLSREDVTCDGIDDDCSGQADEDFVEKGSTCGVGRCATKGVVSCKEGKAVDSCKAADNICTASEKPFCNASGQQCKASMSCTGEPCGECTTPECRRVPDPSCNTTTGQRCWGQSACGPCNCDPVPTCDQTKLHCNDKGQSCGWKGCIACCTDCANGCNANTGACNIIIIRDITARITAQVTAQINPQITTQIVAGTLTEASKARTTEPPSEEAEPPPTGTTSLFTDFFRDLLGISE